MRLRTYPSEPTRTAPAPEVLAASWASPPSSSNGCWASHSLENLAGLLSWLRQTTQTGAVKGGNPSSYPCAFLRLYSLKKKLEHFFSKSPMWGEEKEETSHWHLITPSNNKIKSYFLPCKLSNWSQATTSCFQRSQQPQAWKANQFHKVLSSTTE